VIETPLHPHAARVARIRLIGEAYVRLGEAQRANGAFRLFSERAMLAPLVNPPLALITLSGV
jgi:hypothetical protein